MSRRVGVPRPAPIYIARHDLEASLASALRAVEPARENRVVVVCALGGSVRVGARRGAAHHT
jgi:hypothetical protein